MSTLSEFASSSTAMDSIRITGGADEHEIAAVIAVLHRLTNLGAIASATENAPQSRSRPWSPRHARYRPPAAWRPSTTHRPNP
ncbi:hypothetical protein BKA25_000635 [Actinoalloteichus hymeniacidonis]|uniref:Acyl-CoA carboxylase epsilon subunit n=1 Tax=Actinoalloteichus hymeniacidonis TaxID=340345 RepID=A0AAC9HUX4_9PSEU|nr:hypothetical protein TL08_24065 [Actinoalloteichus hymeniacidonis]MBB5906319.1 hypothetical protein [Actinoalloteichus hymeniacidonis]